MRPDRRSPEAAAYRRLYKGRRWAGLRQAQLAKQPLCERDVHSFDIVPATVVNHRRPHKGDLRLFFDPTNLQSVCKPCHDGPIQREELQGFSAEVDTGGWPTDPNHPTNRTRS